MNDTQDLQLAADNEPTQGANMRVQTIHIDSRGFLALTRKSSIEPCFCPHASPNMTIRCGTWCPLLEEPVALDNGRAFIKLCCAPSLCLIEGQLEDLRNA